MSYAELLNQWAKQIENHKKPYQKRAETLPGINEIIREAVEYMDDPQVNHMHINEAIYTLARRDWNRAQ